MKILLRHGRNWPILPNISTTNEPVFTGVSALYAYYTSGSAMAEGPRDALVSRNSATTKYPYRMALFA